MDITVSLSDDEAAHLKGVAAELGLSFDETMRTVIRSFLAATHDLPFGPDSSLSYEDAVAIITNAVRQQSGTFFVIRMGRDPGKMRVLQLQSAIRRVWHRLRTANSFPRPVCDALASILFFAVEARSNLDSNPESHRAELTDELGMIVQMAFQVLTQPSYDSDQPHFQLGDRSQD